MFLQGDKPNTTLTREKAARVLFEPENRSGNPPDTFVNFAYDHNVAEFKELIQTKYPQVVNVETPTATAGSNLADVQLNKYHTGEVKYETPQGGAMNRYYNDTNPIPYQTFKPRMLTDFEDLQVAGRSEPDTALMQKIDEVQIYDPKETAVVDADEETETVPYLKLNAKGLIACVAFVAVTLLIVLLVIINSVAISGAGTQIKRLRETNSQLQSDYDNINLKRSQAYESGKSGAEALAQSEGYVLIIPESVPPISTYKVAPENPDKSTNFFDQIARFFSSLFS